MSNERDTNRLSGINAKFFGGCCPRRGANGCAKCWVAESFDAADELQSRVKSCADGATVDGAFEFGVQQWAVGSADLAHGSCCFGGGFECVTQDDAQTTTIDLGGAFNDPTTCDEVVDTQVFGKARNKGDGFGIEVDSDGDIASAGVVSGDVDANVDATGRKEKDKCADEGKQAT